MNQIFVPVTLGSQTFVLAHRGASRAEQENTVLAFRAAGDMGADGVELDVRLTADGHLVVHHDSRLEDGRDICALQRSELPAHIPTMHEALDACAGMWVNVEIKNDEKEPDFDSSDSVAELVARALVERNENSRFLISSFRRETINKVHDFAPELRTAWLMLFLLRRFSQQCWNGDEQQFVGELHDARLLKFRPTHQSLGWCRWRTASTRL